MSCHDDVFQTGCALNRCVRLGSFLVKGRARGVQELSSTAEHESLSQLPAMTIEPILSHGQIPGKVVRGQA